MRILAFAAAAALAISIVNPTFAAKSQKQDVLALEKADNPQSFDACVALAKQRGYTSADRVIGDRSSAVRKFVEGCMAGKQQ
jgi:hypothetical protein